MAKGRWIDDRAVKKMETEIWEKCLILSAAYLMDEMDYNEDKVVDYFTSMTKYLEAIDDHLLTMDKVCEIIKEHSGVDIRRVK